VDLLPIVADISLSIAGLCALLIAIDEFRHRQKMAIMNVVWPVTALYFSVGGLWAYFKFGRKMAREAHSGMSERRQKMEEARRDPTWVQIAISVSHCGAGCACGDVVAEFLVFGLSLSIAGVVLWADYSLDLAVAWLFGIAFQYFTIKPMRDLPPGKALAAAIKADTLSILAFQIGMYAWMALVYFVFFARAHLHPDQPGYWLMMQIAMIAGFLTAFPMNRWLLKRGVKEAMG
jgi:Domain of unknown function (DUF4396)